MNQFTSIIFCSLILSAASLNGQTPRLFKDLDDTFKPATRGDHQSLVTWKGKTYAVITGYESGPAVFELNGPNYQLVFSLPNGDVPQLLTNGDHLFVHNFKNLYAFSDVDQSLTPLIDPALEPGYMRQIFTGGDKLFWQDQKDDTWRFWESDGTPQGTRIVDGNLPSQISLLDYYNGHVYYLDQGDLKHFGSGGLNPQINTFIRNFKWLGDTLILSNSTDLMYWSQADGLVIDQETNFTIYELNRGVVFKQELFFHTHRNEIYVTDGTPGGLRELARAGFRVDFFPGTDRLYATALDIIWLLTSSGARSIAINSHLAPVNVFDDRLFYTIWDQIYAYNPITKEVELVLDLYDGEPARSQLTMAGATPDGVMIAKSPGFFNADTTPSSLLFHDGAQTVPLNRTDITGGSAPGIARALDDNNIIFPQHGNQEPRLTRANHNTVIDSTIFPNGLAAYYNGRYIYGVYNDANRAAIYARTPEGDPILLAQAEEESGRIPKSFIRTQWGLVFYGSLFGPFITDGTPEGTKPIDLPSLSLVDFGSFGDYHIFGNNNVLALYDGDQITQIHNRFDEPIINLGDTLAWINRSNIDPPMIWIYDLPTRTSIELADLEADIFAGAPLNDQIILLLETGIHILTRQGDVSQILNDSFSDGDSLYSIAPNILLATQKRENGYRLLRTMGAIEDTYPLAHFDHIGEGHVFSGSLYFNASTDGGPTNLWVSDGTIPGTRPIGAPSHLPQRAENFNALGAQLWFSWFTPETGRELFSLCRQPDAAIQTQGSVCQSGGVANAIWAGPGASYQWSIQGGSITSGQGSRSIAFQPDGGASVTLDLLISTPDGCTASSSLTIPTATTAPPQPGPITGPLQVCLDDTQLTYSVAPVIGASHYQWTLPQGAFLISGQGTATIQIVPGPLGGDISVTPSNACAAGPAQTLTYTVFDANSQAYAGPDQTLCQTSVQLNGSAPAPGSTGQWTILSGLGGSFSDPSLHNTQFTGQAGEAYRLLWTIDNSCGQTSDQVLITFAVLDDTADAGPDIWYCHNQFDHFLDAVLPVGAIGTWSVVSASDDNYSFSDGINDPNTRFRGSSNGLYTLRWTVELGQCAPITDDITIGFSAPFTPLPLTAAFAELGQPITLDAAMPPGWTGQWSILSGPSLDLTQFSDPNLPNATFNPTGGVGDYELQWSLTHPSCLPITGVVTYTVELPGRMVYQVLDGSDEFYADKTIDLTGTPLLSRVQHPTSGNELWTLDQNDDPQIIREIGAGNLSASIGTIVVFNGIAYFPASDGLHGQELWRTDGTQAGTWMVKDINPQFRNGLQRTTSFAQVDGYLYFPANDGSSGFELWRTDGTEVGTQLVADIFTGVTGSEPSDLAAFDGQIIFTADNGASGREPFLSDGTQLGTTLLADIAAGDEDSSPRNFTQVGAGVFFSAQTIATGRELYWSDGSSTNLVTDLSAGPTDSTLSAFTGWQNKLWFGVFDQGVVKVFTADSNSAAAYGDFGLKGSFATFNGNLYWRDGTSIRRTSGDPNDVTAIHTSSYTTGENITEHKGRLYFDADYRTGGSLWSTDGTIGGDQPMRFDEPYLRQIVSSGDRLIIISSGNKVFTAEPPDHSRYHIQTDHSICAGQDNLTAQLNGAQDQSITWTITNGTILQGQGTDQIIYRPGPRGTVVLQAQVGTGRDASKISRVTPILTINYRDWNRQPQYFSDPQASGVSDIRNLIKKTTQCQ